MRHVPVVLVAIAAMLVGFYLSAQHYAESAMTVQPEQSKSLVGSRRPDFSLDSNSGSIITAADFSDKTLLINFWATWCAPCRQEMPMLMDLQTEYGPMGLQVVGIALDDAENVSNFVKTYGISYPILVSDTKGFVTSAAYGNSEGVLPYSVLVDKNGIIRWQHAGVIRHEKVAGLLAGVL